MKRIFVSLCVAMMILLAGCGQTADSVSETISQASDLNKAGYIIGVPEGTPPEEVAKGIMPNADISYFTQFMDGVAALKSGKVTAVIYDSSGVDRILLSNPDLIKLDEELGNILKLPPLSGSMTQPLMISLIPLLSSIRRMVRQRRWLSGG